MKIKQILATTGLAALLSIGAGVGIAANKGASSVKAGGGTEANHTIYVAVSTATVESESYTDFNVRVNTQIDGYNDIWAQRTLTNIGDTTTYEGMTVFAGVYAEMWDGVNVMQIQLYDGDNWKEQKQPVSSWTEESFENKLYNYSTGEWVTGYVPPVTYRTVTQYAVKDGFLDSTPLGSDPTVIDGNKYPAPAAPSVKGYHFEGWFSDVDCLFAWDDENVITADTSIYAKFTTIVEDSFVYWVDKDSTCLTNVYFWGEYEPVAWPGKPLSQYKVSDVLYYAGEGKLYRIPVPSIGEYKMILNGSEYELEAKTDNITVTPYSLIYTWFDHQDSSRIYNFSVVDGNAAGFVAEVERLRNRVVADPSKNILQYSICGVDPRAAQGLYNMYYEFPADVKESVDKSYTYTYEGSYDGTNVPSETNITFDKIMLALKTVAENNHLPVQGSSLFFMIEAQESNNMIMIIVISASATMLLATALLIIKKRKSHK